MSTKSAKIKYLETFVELQYTGILFNLFKLLKLNRHASIKLIVIVYFYLFGLARHNFKDTKVNSRVLFITASRSGFGCSFES